MSNENETTTNENETAQDIQDPGALPASISIENEIKTIVAEYNDEVRERYIDAEVNAKIDSRVALVKKAMGYLNTLRNDLRKLTPDDVKYDEAGKVVQSLFTKDSVEKRKKILERQGKIEKALGKALEKADYSELEKL